MIPFITTGLFINDLRSDSKPKTELFIEKPQTFFGNMRKIHILALGSGLSFPKTLSALSAAGVIVHLLSTKNAEKEGDFLALDKPDFEEMNRRLMVSVNTMPIYEETLSYKPEFDFQKQSKRNRFHQQDIKSQKLKTKHRRRM